MFWNIVKQISDFWRKETFPPTCTLIKNTAFLYETWRYNVISLALYLHVWKLTSKIRKFIISASMKIGYKNTNNMKAYRIINRYIVLWMNPFAQVKNREKKILYVWQGSEYSPLKLDIRQQIKPFLKALLHLTVVNKYFRTVGWYSDETASRCPVRTLFLIFFWKTRQKRPGRESLFNKFSCRFLQILKEHGFLKKPIQTYYD